MTQAMTASVISESIIKPCCTCKLKATALAASCAIHNAHAMGGLGPSGLQDLQYCGRTITTESHSLNPEWCALQEEVSGASELVDQLQAALKEAQAANSNSSAELVAGLQAELERQAGVIGELRTQLRASTEAQEDLRRQTVSLVEAQAHMAQHSVVEGPPAGVARMQAHLLEKVTAPPLLLRTC